MLGNIGEGGGGGRGGADAGIDMVKLIHCSQIDPFRTAGVW